MGLMGADDGHSHRRQAPLTVTRLTVTPVSCFPSSSLSPTVSGDELAACLI